MRAPALGSLAVARLGLVALAACGGDGPRLTLAPIHTPPCGDLTGARTLLVTPLGDFVGERLAVPLDAVTTLPTLPEGTRGLAVEVLGGAGEPLAIGRTTALALDELADGATIPIAMGPPDGLCAAGALGMARDRPAAVVVGDGVLVVGGAAVASAERYDPDTETSAPQPLPAAFTGVVGAGVAALPDGRAVVIGGVRPGFTVYTPGAGFGPAGLLAEPRAHHVTLALDAHTVLIAGGCGVVDDTGACEGDNARKDSRVVDLDTGDATPGPALTLARRDGVGVLELGPDGRRTVLLVGGTDEHGDPVTAGERLSLDGGAAVTLAGVGAHAAALPSGATVTGFAVAGAPADATVAVVVPGVPSPRGAGAVPPRSGPALVTQDDGAVVVLGGGGPPLRYRPALGDWAALRDPGVALDGAAAVPWRDGTILAFGGRERGVASAAVWRFRPRLLGPLTGAVTVVPADRSSEPSLVPLDPAAVDRAGGWALGGSAPSWAVVGGPTGGTLTLDLTLTVGATGVAVVTGFVDAADHDDLVLTPGQAARLERIRGGQPTTPCRGAVVTAAAGPWTVHVELSGGSVRATVDGATALTCALDDRPRGLIGVAARGEPVRVGSIAVSR